MRVLHIITGLRRAGAETMLAKLVVGLAREGWENRVVCLSERGPLAVELEASGTAVEALNAQSWLAPRAFARLLAIMRRYKPDVVQTWLYHADLAGLISAILLHQEKRLIWNLRCSDVDFDLEQSPGTRVLVQTLARLSGWPAAIIVNSHRGQVSHAQLGYKPRQWIEIPNGFDLDRWRPDPGAAPRLRDLLGLFAGTTIVGMCARVAPMKDHATFFAALAALRSRVPGVHAVVAGYGTERLDAMTGQFGLEKCVSLLGEREDLPALVPGFDVFCLSSAFGEGFPNVLGEAMACGVPCVATDVGDAAEIVGDTGVIVPASRPDELAIALASLLQTTPESRRELGLRARARIEHHYSLEAIARRYAETYAVVQDGTRSSK